MKKRSGLTMLLLILSMNLHAGESHIQDDKDAISMQQKIERLAGLASAIALGCVSGYFCAKLYPILGKKIENEFGAAISDTYWNSKGEKWISELYWKNGQKNIAMGLYLFLWAIPESIASGYLIEELKQSKIDHNQNLIRFACSISSWITFLLA